MDVEIFTLCEAANYDNNRLNILGATDRIVVRYFPITFPQWAVALRLRFAKIEEGEKRIRINIVDRDGKMIVSGETLIQAKAPENTDSSSANIVVIIHNLILESAGDYAIDLAINERQEGSLPLYVRKED